jgi:hypothetical protein
MVDNTRRGGVLKTTIAGVAYEVEADITVQPYRFQNESVQGVTGPSGHKRTAIQPKITMTLFKRSDQPLSFLRNLENARVVIVMYEGTQWIGTRCTRVGEMPLDLAEGTFTIEIDSPDEIVEIPPS